MITIHSTFLRIFLGCHSHLILYINLDFEHCFYSYSFGTRHQMDPNIIVDHKSSGPRLRWQQLKWWYRRVSSYSGCYHENLQAKETCYSFQIFRIITMVWCLISDVDKWLYQYYTCATATSLNILMFIYQILKEFDMDFIVSKISYQLRW